MKRLLLLALLLLPQIAAAQGFGGSCPKWLTLWSESGGTLTLDGDLVADTVTATSFTATASSGVTAIQLTAGAKLCLDTGSTGCFLDNGSYIALTGSKGLYVPGVYSTSAISANSIYVNGGAISAWITEGSLKLRGNESSDGAAVAVKSGNVNSLTTSGDQIHAFYSDAFSTKVSYVDKDGIYGMDGTDESGTPGAATINKASGLVAVAAGASSVVVNNSLVAGASTTPVVAVAQAADATCTQIANVVPASGSFTINMNAACTGNTAVYFEVRGMF